MERKREKEKEGKRKKRRKNVLPTDLIFTYCVYLSIFYDLHGNLYSFAFEKICNAHK